MRLAASSIAWPAGADEEAALVLRAGGAAGVELAPTKVWASPAEATEADARAQRAFWEDRGLEVVAMQALLFGRPDLTLFDDPGARRRTVEHLAALVRLGGRLGCRALVFGSPKNRLAGARPAGEVRAAAVDAFRRLGDAAVAAGLVFAIEPNPPAYGCDFVTTVADGVALVEAVGHPGFGLHLDAGGMALTAESPASARLAPAHYHVSEPGLAPVGTGGADHARFARELRRAGYGGWCSLEMRQPEGDWRAALADSLARAAACYGRD
jgi:sugar phosphate isomerase/epimerase